MSNINIQLATISDVNGILPLMAQLGYPGVVAWLIIYRIMVIISTMSCRGQAGIVAWIIKARSMSFPRRRESGKY